MRASAARFGIAWGRYQLIGVAELAAAAGVLAAWPCVRWVSLPPRVWLFY
jgi:hypothetical protein